MNVEALPPDGGVARASVNGIEHIRLRDLAGAVPGLQPDPRWPSIGFADTAARMFVDESGVLGVMIHNLKERGRYVPRDQLQPAIDFLTSSATIAEAKSRTWAGINANRSRRTKTVKPIVIESVRETEFGLLQSFNAEDLPAEAYHFVIHEAEIYLARNPVIHAGAPQYKIAGLNGLLKRLVYPVAIRVDINANGGTASAFVPLSIVPQMFEILSKRADYDRMMVGRLMRRLEELSAAVQGQVVASATAQVKAPDPATIVAQTMEAGASQLPAIPDDLPEIQQLRQEHGEAWAEIRRGRADRLKGVPPEPNSRTTTALEIVRRMGLIETGQEAMIERLDRVLAQKDEQISGRDRQIGELQELVIGLGQFCTNLLGSIAELKAIATR